MKKYYHVEAKLAFYSNIIRPSNDWLVVSKRGWRREGERNKASELVPLADFRVEIQ